MAQNAQQSGRTAATAGKSSAPSVFASLTPEEVKSLQSVIQPTVSASFPDIVKMLFETPSLSIKEKQYWLQLLPLMTPEQVDKLKNILVTERAKLLDLGRRYEEALQNISTEKTLSPEEQQKNMQVIRKKEAEDQRKEENAENDLLSTLSKV